MCKCNIQSQNFKLETDITPSADFMSCLFPAVIAALPVFLEAFMRCIAGTPSDDQYRPGSRNRCQ